MEEVSKVILGLEIKKRARKAPRIYTDTEKHFIIKAWLESGLTKQAIWEKYTGQPEEHGQILRWMRSLGYAQSSPHGNLPIEMKKKSGDPSSEVSFEELQLQRRVQELERQLKEAEMKAIALATMVDLAEKEFNISIRKKYNTKRSKK